MPFHELQVPVKATLGKCGISVYDTYIMVMVTYCLPLQKMMAFPERMTHKIIILALP